MKKVIGMVVVLFVVALVCLAGSASADTAMKLKIGEKAPDFKLKDITSGTEFKLSDYAGKKVVMLEFWAEWCEICKREMPNLVKLQNEWGPKGFQILSVVLPGGGLDGVKKIIKDKKLNYPALLDVDMELAMKKYGLAGPIPLKVVIDKKGVIRYAHVGDFPPGEDELPFVIEDLLKEK